MLRLEAIQTEPLHQHQLAHALDNPTTAEGPMVQTANIEDLMGRIGARIGLDQITHRHSGDSHIPEKSAQILAAAWSEPADNWPKPSRPRPLLLWPPEPVAAPEPPHPASTVSLAGARAAHVASHRPRTSGA